MCFLLFRFRVKNYTQWKTLYDDYLAERREAGCKHEHILRSLSDPNDVTIIYEWDTVGNAEIYVESPSLRDSMQRTGALGQPEVRYLEEMAKRALTAGRVLRAG